jgi:Protein of unknown function (DUF3551)
MRFLLAALLASAAVSAAAPAQAHSYDPYAWCAEYGGRGGGNCNFVTYQQCAAAISGNGGLCRRNVFYTGPGSYGDEHSYRPRYRYRSAY